MSIIPFHAVFSQYSKVKGTSFLIKVAASYLQE